MEFSRFTISYDNLNRLLDKKDVRVSKNLFIRYSLVDDLTTNGVISTIKVSDDTIDDLILDGEKYFKKFAIYVE